MKGILTQHKSKTGGGLPQASFFLMFYTLGKQG